MNVPEEYSIRIRTGKHEENLQWNLRTGKLTGHSWLLQPLNIPTNRRLFWSDIDRLIRVARRTSVVTVEPVWPPPILVNDVLAHGTD